MSNPLGEITRSLSAKENQSLCVCGHDYMAHIDAASPFCNACKLCRWCDEFTKPTRAVRTYHLGQENP